MPPFVDLARWDNKVALVTGATSGIGYATALALAEIGMRLAIAGRRHERLEALRERLEALGSTVLILPGDQTVAETNYALFRTLRETWGGVDVVINNAGTSGGRGFADVDFASIQRCLDLNVTAAAIVMQAAIQAMRHKQDAAIINISSLQAHRLIPGKGSAAYAASKQALRALTEGARAELATEKSRLKIAMVSPGLVASEFHDAAQREADFPYRALEPEDIANAILYLLSTPPHVQVCDILIRSVEQVQ
jgi:NADP+-dependent farnesol dehydrogenase